MATPIMLQEQRNYTAQAGKLAGLKIKKIISEPTAAAMAYGLHKKDGESSYSLPLPRARKLSQ